MKQLNKRVLVVVPNHGAVGGFRSLNPHKYIKDNSDSDDLLILDIDKLPINKSSECGLIHFHATSLFHPQFCEYLIKEKDAGIKLVMDIDDYWVIPETNPAHGYFKKDLTRLIPKALEWVDGVTTTTKLFADEIKKLNKNVCILPNIISNPRKSVVKPQKRLRVGVLCGATHYEDLQLLKNLVSELSNYQDKIQFVLCGFNTGEESNPHLSIWNSFEQILTNNYSILDTDYKKHLLTYNKDSRYDDSDAPYIRRWSKPMETYSELYDDLDVLLCPLVNDKFNCMKSELKALEAGTYNKVLICSEVGIYKKLFTHNENCLMVNPHRNSDWSKHIKTLIDQPEKIDRLQKKLHNLVIRNYNQDTITDKRIEFYNNI